MSEALVPLPRFEEWNEIKGQSQNYALMKDYGISVEKIGDEFSFQFVGAELIDDEKWLALRLLVSATLLHESVVVDPDIRGGVPVLRGTRISLSQILIEISDGETVGGFADEYDIDDKMIKHFLEGLSIHLDRSFAK